MNFSFYKSVTVVIAITFIVYFTVTFIFCLPENFLPKKLESSKAKFQVLFYQKWGSLKYSAPFNSRLYYIIKDRSTGKEVASVELLKNIRQQKTLHAPFNQNEITIDNIIDRCMGEVLAVQAATINNLKVTMPGLTQEVYMQKASLWVNGSMQCREELQTLKNYATIIAKENNIDTTGNKVEILFAEKYFPEFDKRKEWATAKETIVFQSPDNFFK